MSFSPSASFCFSSSFSSLFFFLLLLFGLRPANERELRSLDECGNNVPLEFAIIEMCGRRTTGRRRRNEGRGEEEEEEEKEEKREKEREPITRFSVWGDDKVTECPINALMSLYIHTLVPHCGEPGSHRLLTHIPMALDVRDVTFPFKELALNDLVYKAKARFISATEMGDSIIDSCFMICPLINAIHVEFSPNAGRFATHIPP